MPATSTDPVFAAIENRRRAFAVYDRHLRHAPEDKGAAQEWEAARRDFAYANHKAEKKLFKTAATSKEGLLAYLAEIKKMQKQSGPYEDDTFNLVVATVARAIRNIA
jgi:hypothetical protein